MKQRMVWIYLCALALVGGFACESGKSDDGSESAGEKSDEKPGASDAASSSGGGEANAADATTEPAPDPFKETAPPGSGFEPYAKYVVDGTVAIGVAHPERLVAELEREKAAAASASASVGDFTALDAKLGGLSELLTGATWTAAGLDPTRPVGFVLSMSGSESLKDVFKKVSAKLAGVNQIYELIRRSGESATGASDQQIRDDAAAYRASLNNVGIGVRLIVPVSSADDAAAWIGGHLESAGFAAQGEREGAVGFYQSESGVPIVIRKVEATDVILVEAGYIADDSDAAKRATGALAIIDGFADGTTKLEAPLPDDAVASFAIAPAELGRWDFVRTIDNGLEKVAKIQKIKRGKRAEEGNAMLDWVERLEKSLVMFDEVVRRGPHQSHLTTIYSRASSSEPTRIVSRALFSEAVGALDQSWGGPSLSVDNSFVTVSASPKLLASAGPWADAGLAPKKRVTLATLKAAADDGTLPSWYNNPLMVGLWAYPFAGSAWKAAPEALRAIPADDVERAIATVGASGAGLAALDAGASADTWKHALACAGEGKSSADSCADDQVGTDAATRLPGVTFHARVVDESGTIRASAAKDVATVDALASATQSNTEDALNVRVDFSAVANAGLPTLLSPLATELATTVRSVELSVRPAGAGVAWTLNVDSDYTLLIALHGLLDTAPVAVPDSSALVSMGLGAFFEDHSFKEPRTKTGGGGGGGPVAQAPKNKGGIEAVFTAKKSQVEKCYRRVMQKFGANPGTLSVTVHINADGSVNKVKVVSDKVGNGFGTCVTQAIQKWKFPSQHALVQVGKRWTMK